MSCGGQSVPSFLWFFIWICVGSSFNDSSNFTINFCKSFENTFISNIDSILVFSIYLILICSEICTSQSSFKYFVHHCAPVVVMNCSNRGWSSKALALICSENCLGWKIHLQIRRTCMMTPVSVWHLDKWFYKGCKIQFSKNRSCASSLSTTESGGMHIFNRALYVKGI